MGVDIARVIAYNSPPDAMMKQTETVGKLFEIVKNKKRNKGGDA